MRSRRVEAGVVHIWFEAVLPDATGELFSSGTGFYPDGQRFFLGLSMPDGAALPYVVRDVYMNYGTAFLCVHAIDSFGINQWNTPVSCDVRTDATLAEATLTAQDPTHAAGSFVLPVPLTPMRAAICSCWLDGAVGDNEFNEDPVDVTFDLLF